MKIGGLAHGSRSLICGAAFNGSWHVTLTSVHQDWGPVHALCHSLAAASSRGPKESSLLTEFLFGIHCGKILPLQLLGGLFRLSVRSTAFFVGSRLGKNTLEVLSNFTTTLSALFCAVCFAL